MFKDAVLQSPKNTDFESPSSPPSPANNTPAASSSNRQSSLI
jgi:hypothetical protein